MRKVDAEQERDDFAPHLLSPERTCLKVLRMAAGVEFVHQSSEGILMTVNPLFPYEKQGCNAQKTLK